VDVEKLKMLLGLRPLAEEGGFYSESYRSPERWARTALPARYSGERCLGSAIYYLLTPETFSAMHRLASDEIYHFYLGDPVELLLLREDGSGEVITIGSELESGMRPQALAPLGVWQGSRLKAGGAFALLGTTVAPGFEFADFELGRREALLAQFPAHADWIRALTR
jgi:predicted cupin superfamily sugar epimerase